MAAAAATAQLRDSFASRVGGMSAAPTAADAAADSEERAARQARVLRQQKMAAEAKWSDPSYGSAEAGAAAALQGLEKACRSDDNIMPAMMEALAAEVTLGEIGDVYRDVFGDWNTPIQT